jgi:hypothetical protein
LFVAVELSMSVFKGKAHRARSRRQPRRSRKSRRLKNPRSPRNSRNRKKSRIKAKLLRKLPPKHLSRMKRPLKTPRKKHLPRKLSSQPSLYQMTARPCCANPSRVSSRLEKSKASSRKRWRDNTICLRHLLATLSRSERAPVDRQRMVSCRSARDPNSSSKPRRLREPKQPALIRLIYPLLP